LGSGLWALGSGLWALGSGLSQHRHPAEGQDPVILRREAAPFVKLVSLRDHKLLDPGLRQDDGKNLTPRA
ncbi:MAG: hypothetical protein AAF438_01545, partial [Pseudomonadota bacterium]